ncbi:hypothetical protein DLM46_24495 [Paraburkholderia lacunae]|uniref:H repeat-associated protein N-terminal domain-containing protein n=2 Tax=Paraburkholderia lacunae TaxID=2211104 RepID=A0A370N3I2_9BURK|nr:hypothetical protein DLM46_24495 [Paraburkholderia lacunae]
MQEGVFGIGEAFGDLRDPRSRMPAHDLTEMLVVALRAILSSANSWVEIQTCGEAKLECASVPGVGRSGGDPRRQDSARRPSQRSACAPPGVGLRQWLGRGTETGVHRKQKQHDHGNSGVARSSNGISFRASKTACTGYST